MDEAKNENRLPMIFPSDDPDDARFAKAPLDRFGDTDSNDESDNSESDSGDTSSSDENENERPPKKRAKKKPSMNANKDKRSK